MSSKYNFPKLLRSRMCDHPGTDHGHTDCWIFGEAALLIESQAAEIERLKAENREHLQSLEQFSFEYEEARQAAENRRSFELVRHLLPNSKEN